MSIKTEIEKYALQLSKHDENIKKYEALLKKEKEAYNLIRMKDLANLMQNEGCEFGTKILLSNGRTVILKEFFNASIPSATRISKEKDFEKKDELIEKRKNCIKWLTDNGLGDIIKNTITINFAKEENAKMEKIMLLLRDNETECVKEEHVHSSTLKAALKDLISDCKNIDFELFNISSGPIVVLK